MKRTDLRRLITLLGESAEIIRPAARSAAIIDTQRAYENIPTATKFGLIAKDPDLDARIRSALVMSGDKGYFTGDEIKSGMTLIQQIELGRYITHHRMDLCKRRRRINGASRWVYTLKKP